LIDEQIRSPRAAKVHERGRVATVEAARVELAGDRLQRIDRVANLLEHASPSGNGTYRGKKMKLA